MAKKGRVARILTTLHRVAGTPVSEALKRRQRSAIQRGDAGTHSGTVSQWRKRKDRQRRREQFEGAAKETGLPNGYHSGMRILLVGEGNLSFALALTTLFDGDGSNLLVTSFDRQRMRARGVPVLRGRRGVPHRRGRGGGVRRGRGGTRRPPRGGETMVGRRGDGGGDNPTGQGVGPGGHFKGFDRIVFNFPDAGVGVTPPRPSERNVSDMLGAFFDSAKGLLKRNGERARGDAGASTAARRRGT